jgi:hypothetical protein
VVVPRKNLSMYKKAIHESLEEAAEVRKYCDFLNAIVFIVLIYVRMN